MVPVQQHVISQLEFPTGRIPIPWTRTLDLRISRSFFSWMQLGDWYILVWDLFGGPVKRTLFRRLGRSDCSPENCQKLRNSERRSHSMVTFFERNHTLPTKTCDSLFSIPEVRKERPMILHEICGNPLAVQLVRFHPPCPNFRSRSF